MSTATSRKPALSTEPTGLRFYQVKGDNMEPTICNRDFVLLAPVSRYVGEGYYLIGKSFGETIYSCNGFGRIDDKPAIRLHPHNKFYRSEDISKADFDERVLGKVAMICHVVDHRLLPEGTL